MTLFALDAFEQLSPEQKTRVNEACQRFEHGLLQGRPEPIELFLAHTPPSLRAVLLRELLLLECEYGYRLAQPPAALDLQRRFPGQEALIEATLLAARSYADAGQLTHSETPAAEAHPAASLGGRQPQGVFSRYCGFLFTRNGLLLGSLLLAALFAASLGYYISRLAETNRQLAAAQVQREQLTNDLRTEQEQRQAERRAYVVQRYPDRLRRAWGLAHRNQRVALRQLLDDCNPSGTGDLRGFEWYYLQRLIIADLQRYRDCKSPIHALALTSDGRTVAVACADGRVRLCATDSLQCSAELTHPHGVYDVAFSPDDGKLATTCSDPLVRLWSREGQFLAELTGARRPVRTVAFTPDGRKLAAASLDGAIRLYDLSALERPPLVLPFPAGKTASLAFTRDGATLIAAGTDEAVRFYHLADSSCSLLIQASKRQVERAALSPQEDCLAVACEDGCVQLWTREMNQGKEASWQLVNQTEDFQQVRALSFSPDGKTLAIAAVDALQVWECVPFHRLHNLTGQEGTVYAARFQPDGRRLLTGGSEGVVRYSSLTEFADVQRSPLPAAAAALLEGVRLAAIEGKKLTPSDRTAELLRTPLLDTLQGRADVVAVSPDGRTVAAANSDGTLRLWHTATGQELAVLLTGSGPVLTLAFSPDGRYLMAATADTASRPAELFVWDAGPAAAYASK